MCLKNGQVARYLGKARQVKEIESGPNVAVKGSYVIGLCQFAVSWL